MRDASKLRSIAWMATALVLAAAGPAIANVDLVNPLCDGPEPLTVAAVVDLVLSTMIQRGLSILLLGAAIVVGLPWLIAGAAVALVRLPRRLGR